MNETRTKAWIMYALAMASENGAVSFASISQVADGINHAVPTQKEMQESLSWLVANNMVLKLGSKYQLTEEGAELITLIRVHNNTISSVWISLTESLTGLNHS